MLRGWQPPPSPWAAGHRGVDLAARPAERVRAAAAGRVSFAGPVAGREVLVIELSGAGSPPLRTTYEPVHATVSKGERVAAGQVVGVVAPGPFHCPPGCLHWGLRRADRYLDPLSLLPPSMLRGGPSRLLPVFAVRDAPMVSALASPAGDTRLSTAAALMAASLWARIRLGRPSASRPRRPRPGRTRIRSRRGAPRTRSRPGHAPRAPGDPHAQWGGWGGGEDRRGSALDAAQGHGDGRLGDPLGVLGRAELDTPDRRVHDALEQHGREPGLLMPESREGLDHHGDQPAMGGPDLLPRARVQLTGGDRHHRTVPSVADERQLPTDIRLDLRLRPVGPLHGGLDLGGPDREVDGAQFLDHGGAGAEILIDGGPCQSRVLGEGGEGQRLRTTLGQQGAGGLQKGRALHRPVLGH
ncbi:hypothetical protein SMALB_6703 [Streptomyces malaysiensis]|uniref:M23ase beta-sheet core domain-containing protein n=1 Tax=Streptomyces malaysiensis TaxID=92644 RepID=A0A7X5X8N8_STRMQ|nr:hypothetical protein [Streptomyces malaysiensis]